MSKIEGISAKTVRNIALEISKAPGFGLYENQVSRANNAITALLASGEVYTRAQVEEMLGKKI